MICVTLPPRAPGDEKKALWTISVIGTQNPNLVLCHLTSLDHQEHEHAPFSTESDTAIETVGGFEEPARRVVKKTADRGDTAICRTSRAPVGSVDAGGGVANGRNLGIVNMRRIASTLAHMLAISSPAAQLQPVPNAS